VPPLELFAVDQVPSPLLKLLDRTVEAKFVAAPVRLTVLPAHTVLVELLAVTAVGPGFTMTVTVVEPGTPHPVFKPVMVYVVVEVGSAVTVAPVVLLKPAAGDQLYVVAPEAVSVTPTPEQVVGESGVTITVGVHGIPLNSMSSTFHTSRLRLLSAMIRKPTWLVPSGILITKVE